MPLLVVNRKFIRRSKIKSFLEHWKRNIIRSCRQRRRMEPIEAEIRFLAFKKYERL